MTPVSPTPALEQRRQQLARRRSTIPAALRDLQQALGAPRELRALGQLRRHQWQRDIELRIHQAMDNAPEDPGPLNPRMLALRSLSAAGERSPAYLRHIVAYLDTLVWLEAQ